MRDEKRFVGRATRFVVPVGELDLQPAWIVIGQPVEVLVANPEVRLSEHVAETLPVLCPCSIETDVVALPVLND